MTSKLLDPKTDLSKFKSTVSSSPYSDTAQVESYMIAKGLAKAERLKNAQVAQDFLSNDTIAIKKYLKEDLLRTFDEDDVDEFQFAYINPVPKIVKRISLLYKNPAQREIVGNVVGTDRLNYALKRTGYDKHMRETHKGTKLHNTVLIGVLPDGLGSVRHVILRPDIVDIAENPDNYLEMDALKYPTMRKIKGKEIIVYEYWSKTEHLWLDTDDNIITTDGAPDSSDHPGFMPFIPARLQDDNDFFGNGMLDLIDAVRNINFLMTSALVENIIMSAFGQLLLINTGLSNVKLGPKHPIFVDDVDESMATPDVKNVSGSPHTDETRSTIDWMHKTQGMINGLPASDFSDTETIISGYAKLIDHLELLDEREADALVFDSIELRYLEIFAKMWNIYALGNKKIPEDLTKLNITYPPIKFPETQQEKTEKWRARIEMGRGNQIDWIMEDNPGMNRDDAKKKYLEVQKESRELKMNIRGGAPNSNDLPEED